MTFFNYLIRKIIAHYAGFSLTDLLRQVKLGVWCYGAMLLLSCPVWVVAGEDPFAELTFRAGFFIKSFPDFSLEDAEISVKLLAEELGKDVGIKTSVTIYDDIRVMRNDFEQGKINFVVSSTLSLTTDFDQALFADGFRLVVNSDYKDQILVLARKSAQTSFKSLKGKRLVLAKFDPMTDLVIDYLSWKNFKQGYLSSFLQEPREKKAHQLILKLFFSQADVTCVYFNAYQVAIELNPQLADKLAIVEQIGGVPPGAGLFHVKTPKEFRQRVIEQALKLSDKPRGQQLLQLFNAEQVIQVTVDEFLSVKRLYQDWKQITHEP